MVFKIWVRINGVKEETLRMIHDTLTEINIRLHNASHDKYCFFLIIQTVTVILKNQSISTLELLTALVSLFSHYVCPLEL